MGKNIAAQQTLERPLCQVTNERYFTRMDIVHPHLPLFNDEPPKRPYGLSYRDGKPCTHCHQVKPISEFSIRYSNRCTSWCKKCLRERKKEKYRANHNGAKERASAWSRKNIYGIDNDTYQMMLFMQGGVCAVCGQLQNAKHTKELCVDHNHETGEVRELLCHTCNVLVGFIEKD